MNTPEWIAPRELPLSTGGLSKLYVDYLTDFPKVRQYYESDFHSLKPVAQMAARLKDHYAHRELLVEVLSEQNKRFHPSPETEENIRSLANPQTFAVVTGQQVGMLGGPLYTVYKLITAIKLAQRLNAENPDCKFVPMFWLEGEDHDFEEINKVGLLGPDHLPTKVEYLLNGKPLAKNPGPVGEIALDGYLSTFYDGLQKALGNSEFKTAVLDLVRSAYKPSATFNEAFASMINELLPGSGVVFISVNDPRLKKLLSPIFRKEIEEYPRVSQMIIQRSAELEERYHAQIKTKALNLFLFFKGGRYFIEPRQNDFSLKGTRHFLSRDELLRIAVETPELLSPNVALRPVCQDTLLPTVAYVAGPSEIAYFAQLKNVYEYFDLTMPLIYPRASATIVEERVERILEKYQVDVRELLGNSDRVQKKVIDLVSEIKIDEMFGAAAQHMSDQINELKFGLNYIDSTLLGALETTRSKIEAQMNALKARTEEAQKRKHEIALRQIEKAANSVFPNGNFQERELSIVHFMNKHGSGIVKRLVEELQIDQFKHQLIRI